MGKLETHDVFEAGGFEVIPFAKSTHHLSESQVRPHPVNSNSHTHLILPLSVRITSDQNHK